MALDRFNDDMHIIEGMGDNPKRDDGLSTPQFKASFDKAGLRIQKFINEKLIPQIENFLNEGAILGQISAALNRKFDKTGGDLTGEVNMNGRKVTGLADPENDSDAVPMSFLEPYAKKEYVNRNLSVDHLDNGNFANPVNQKANTEEHAEYYTYDDVVVQDEMVDRWTLIKSGKLGVGALTCVCPGFVRIVNLPVGGGTFETPDGGLIALGTKNWFPEEATFTQYLEEPLPAGSYTFAMKTRSNLPVKLMINDSTVEVAASADWTVNVLSVDDAEVSSVSFAVPAECVADFEWAALYDGKYTAETLPEYSAKDYPEELNKCYRHYFSPNKGKTVIQGIASSTSKLDAVICTPVEMRVKPSVVSATIMALRGGGASLTDSDVSIKSIAVNLQAGNLIRFDIVLNEAKATAREFYQIILEDFALSAEMG